MKIPAFANNFFNMISFRNEVMPQAPSIPFESDEVDNHCPTSESMATNNQHHNENDEHSAHSVRDMESSSTISTDHYQKTLASAPVSLSPSLSSSSSLSLILSAPSSLSLTFSESFEMITMEIDEKTRGINENQMNRIGWEEMVSSYGKVARRV